MTQRLIESFRQNLVLPQHALPLEQMSDTGTERLVLVTSLLYFRNPSFRLSADSLQLMPFLRGQLRALRGKDFAGGDLPQFPGRVSRHQSDFLTVGFRPPLLELFDFTFDFLPAWKTLAERGRDPSISKPVTSLFCRVAGRRSPAPHSAGHLVLIDLARISDGPDHFVFTQRIPFSVPVAVALAITKWV
jgi:hypothetical protein